MLGQVGAPPPYTSYIFQIKSCISSELDHYEKMRQPKIHTSGGIKAHHTLRVIHFMTLKVW